MDPRDMVLACLEAPCEMDHPRDMLRAHQRIQVTDSAPLPAARACLLQAERMADLTARPTAEMVGIMAIITTTDITIPTITSST